MPRPENVRPYGRRRSGQPAQRLPSPSRALVWTAALCALLSGCAGFDTSDGAPSRPRPGLERLPDPVVRNEPRSRYGNDDYEQGGQRYRILPTGAGYDRVGRASWYGAKFHGRRTSSGETYDMYRLTAAHPTLPVPAYARVRNLENGRETIVRINDRGPFHGGRFLDLSYAAAVKLGFAAQGTARVRVTVVTEVSTKPDGARHAPAAQTPPPVARGAGGQGPTVARYFLQAGAFSERRWADARVAALRRIVEDGAQGTVELLHDPADRLYRVRVGPLTSREAARRLQALFAQGAPGDNSFPVIVEE